MIATALALAAAFAQITPPAPVSQPAPPPRTEARWVRVRAPVLEVVSDAGAAGAQEAAQRLQRFRAVLAQGAPVPLLDTSEALLLAVADGEAYRALRPRRDGRAYEVDGFVQGGGVRPLVALHLGPLDETLLEHEYVHLALNGALPAQPLWVSEGLAELFSDWRPEDGGVRLGDLRPEHVRVLRQRGLLPVESVLRAGYMSPEFQDAAVRPLLYATSWALVRLCYDGGSPGGRARFLRYLEALKDGTDAAEAFAAAFGFTPTEAGPRLLRSLDAGPPALRVTLPDEPATTPATAVTAGSVDALAGTLLLGQERDAEAQRRFRAALHDDATLSEAHEGLALLAMRRGAWDEARRALDEARRGRPDDPAVLYHAADLMLRQASRSAAGITDDVERAAAALVERAVARAPHFASAVDLLVRLRPQPRRARIRLLEQAIAHNPGRIDLSFTLAGMYVTAQDPAAAAAVLRRARDTARDETYRFLAEHLLERLGQSNAGVAEATGLWRSLECQPGGVLDFLVEADAGAISSGMAVTLKGGPRRARPAVPVLLRLRAPAPDAVLVQDADGNVLQPQLTCGAQSGAVRARYRVLARGDEGVSGMLITLRLLDRAP